jgi:hypothetical protein
MYRRLHLATAALAVLTAGTLGGVFALTAPAVAARATPTPAPTPTPIADPAVTRVARQQFVAWQAGSVNKALYAPEVVPKLTDAKIAEVSKILAALGALTATVYIGPFSAPDIPSDAHGYIYQMQCSSGSVYLWIVLDARARIATIFFKDKLDVETIERPGTPPPAPPA